MITYRLPPYFPNRNDMASTPIKRRLETRGSAILYCSRPKRKLSIFKSIAPAYKTQTQRMLKPRTFDGLLITDWFIIPHQRHDFRFTIWIWPRAYGVIHMGSYSLYSITIIKSSIFYQQINIKFTLNYIYNF